MKSFLYLNKENLAARAMRAEQLRGKNQPDELEEEPDTPDEELERIKDPDYLFDKKLKQKMAQEEALSGTEPESENAAVNGSEESIESVRMPDVANDEPRPDESGKASEPAKETDHDQQSAIPTVTDGEIIEQLLPLNVEETKRAHDKLSPDESGKAALKEHESQGVSSLDEQPIKPAKKKATKRSKRAHDESNGNSSPDEPKRSTKRSIKRPNIFKM